MKPKTKFWSPSKCILTNIPLKVDLFFSLATFKLCFTLKIVYEKFKRVFLEVTTVEWLMNQALLCTLQILSFHHKAKLDSYSCLHVTDKKREAGKRKLEYFPRSQDKIKLWNRKYKAKLELAPRTSPMCSMGPMNENKITFTGLWKFYELCSLIL